MIRNYFLVALRNLRRHKGFSFINITGLALGLACCLLLAMYLQHELSYDHFHKNADRLVRVIMEYKIGDGGNKGNFTSTKVFPEFKRQFPEVESGVRMSSSSSRILKYGDKVLLQDDLVFVDSTFFQVFDFKLQKGSAIEVLHGPQRMVLTQSAAVRLFGTEEPVGKTVLVGSKQEPYLVTGISADCPANSQIQYSAVASLASIGPLQEDRYSDANFTTYLLMNDKNAIGPLQQKINDLMKKENGQSEFKINFELEPFTKIHLHSPYDAFTHNSNMSYIYIIVGVALLILLIACSTYINLSTARSMERAKEVGIRKVSGAFRSQLFWQFITESSMITLLALSISIAIVIVALPWFNALSGAFLSIHLLYQPSLLFTCLAFVIFITLLAGGYPAMMLSGFQPVKILKGVYKNSVSGVSLRRGLIVFQFCISVILIMGAMVVKSQLHYIQQKQLGYNRDNIIVLDLDTKLVEHLDMVKKELAAIPSVKGVSAAYESPVQIKGGYNMSGADITKSMAVTANHIDENYLKVMGLELLAGADLIPQDVLDASQEDYSKSYYHFILNESAAKALGFTPNEAIGKKMFLDESRPGEIKAVVRDFHFASMHSKIEPLVLFPARWANNLFLKVEGDNIKSTLASIEAKWRTLASHRPFNFHFLDDDYQRLYDAEMRTGKVLTLFAIIAMFLACLGIFGLSTYAAKQRNKEIGVRKVLGASVSQISFLLSSGFLKLVVVAFFVASPIAWLAMNKWLQQFSYRVQIEWWIFLLTVVAVTAIAFFTVSIQAVKAASNNPVKALRTE
jgi:putative ABC transport system permease protein